MKVITEGHAYELENFENPEKKGQEIQFIQKEPKKNSTELKTVKDGTTNEELLAVLIDRTNYLNGKFPDVNNTKALIHLDMALRLFNKRTADRKKRQVEGKAEA